MKPLHLFFLIVLVAATAAFFFLGTSSVNLLTTTGPAVVTSPVAGNSQSVAPAKAQISKEADFPPGTVATDSATGSLKGVAQYDGIAPGPVKIPIAPNQMAGCTATEVLDESRVVDKATNGIKWVIVRIMNANPTTPPDTSKPFTLDQKGCVFSPHVVVVPPGTELTILNPDMILHNVHTLPFDSNDPAENVAATSNLKYKANWLKEPDLIQIRCDVHPWMKGYIVCHDPRYCAISAADGTFEIPHLPPGKYKVNIWHESFGNYMKQETLDVEIKPGAATDMGVLKFKPNKK